jgi:hypothetical protein
VRKLVRLKGLGAVLDQLDLLRKRTACLQADIELLAAQLKCEGEEESPTMKDILDVEK